VFSREYEREFNVFKEKELAERDKILKAHAARLAEESHVKKEALAPAGVTTAPLDMPPLVRVGRDGVLDTDKNFDSRRNGNAAHGEGVNANRVSRETHRDSGDKRSNIRVIEGTGLADRSRSRDERRGRESGERETALENSNSHKGPAKEEPAPAHMSPSGADYLKAKMKERSTPAPTTPADPNSSAPLTRSRSKANLQKSSNV
jgi:hypothetical protein